MNDEQLTGSQRLERVARWSTALADFKQALEDAGFDVQSYTTVLHVTTDCAVFEVELRELR